MASSGMNIVSTRVAGDQGNSAPVKVRARTYVLLYTQFLLFSALIAHGLPTGSGVLDLLACLRCESSQVM